MWGVPQGTQAKAAANCLLVLVVMVPCIMAFPREQTQLVQFGNSFATEALTESTTDLGPLSTTELTTSTDNTTETTDVTTTSVDSTTSRDQNPVFNVWEYALGYDNQVNTRTNEEEKQEQEEGNECMWAIISCCDAETTYDRDNCFEALGCGGAWFNDLCSEEFVNAANNQVFAIFDGGFGKK